MPVEHMDQVLMHALVWNQSGEREIQDNLFERLKDITKIEAFDLHH